MEKTVQAIYENGVLYPLEPLLLGERQQVTLTISDGGVSQHPVSPWTSGRMRRTMTSASMKSDGRCRRSTALCRKLPFEDAPRALSCPSTSSTPAPWPRSTAKETGSDFIDRILSESSSQFLISRLTIIEMESVFALKARIGEIDWLAVLIARRRLEADLGRGRLLVAALNDEHFRGARKLLFKHGAVEALRTLDALQLSVALGLKPGWACYSVRRSGSEAVQVAALEGFARS